MAIFYEDNHTTDIGGSRLQHYNRALLEKKLLWREGPYTRLDGTVQRVLPTFVIHSDEGLETWEKITYLPTYYQTRGEAALLARNRVQLAEWIEKDTVLIDLGCGDIRKVMPLLEEFERLQRPVLYCPLDLSHASIERALEHTKMSRFTHVSFTSLWGTFEDGIEWVNRACGERPRLLLSLGSIFGNDHFPEAVARLRWLRCGGLQRPTDKILLTMDGTLDEEKIHTSYNDHENLFTALIRQGFEHSNEILGHERYREADWRLERRLTRNPTMHRFVLQARRHVHCPGLNVEFQEGDEIGCYEGLKYGPVEMAQQFHLAGLKKYAQWKCPDDEIYQYLLASADA